MTASGRWPKAIVFDLDGTLVDSAPDIREAVNAGFGPLGVKPFEIEAVKTLIGGGAWWLAVAAIAFGLALIPWRGATPPAVPDELCQTDLVRCRDASTRSDT